MNDMTDIVERLLNMADARMDKHGTTDPAALALGEAAYAASVLHGSVRR